MFAALPHGCCSTSSIRSETCWHSNFARSVTPAPRSTSVAAHACATTAHAEPSHPFPASGLSARGVDSISQSSVSEWVGVKSSSLRAHGSARPIARVRASRGASQSGSATSSIRDEHRQRLLKAKQRVADLRAVQPSGRAAQPPVSQIPPVVPSAAAPIPGTDSDGLRTDGLLHLGARQLTGASKDGVHAERQGAGSQAAGLAAEHEQGSQSERPATPAPYSATRTAANGSRGIAAARSSSRRPPPAATAAASNSSSLPAFPPKNPATKRQVNRDANQPQSQVFDHEGASRTKLLDRLSDAARYSAHLEAEAAARAADITAAADHLSTMEQQLTALLRQTGLAAGSASHDNSCAACNILQPHALTQQLARMQQATGQRARMLERAVSIDVPVHYIGVANEVRMMGSFDGWSRGVRLVCRHDSGDVFRRFEGRLLARRGEHLVKFVVDGQWKIASGWPTREDASGGENNVLRIE